MKNIYKNAECSIQLTGLQTGNEKRMWAVRVHHYSARDRWKQNLPLETPFRCVVRAE